jgi:hypothetical protein
MELEELAREDYIRRLDDYRSQEGVTEKDIKQFEKTEIIKRSVDEVKRHA